MPPRTGPRRKRRPKAGAPRHFTILRADETTDQVIVLSVELDGGCLVLRDQAGAIIHIMADGEWREIRPTKPADYSGYLAEMTWPAPPTEPAGRPDERPDEESRVGYNATDEIAPEQATPAPPIQQEPFVPSSPEEAQRILMVNRRLAPNDQDPPDAPPPPRKD